MTTDAGITEGRALALSVARLFPGKWNYHYVKSKIASDPLYHAVDAVLAPSQLPLLDVGCGMGLLSFYLRARGRQFPIAGTDFDARKIATASRLADENFSGLTFRTADATAGLPVHQGNVTLLDILHYLPAAEQQPLLAEAARRVAPNGILVVRSGLRDASWRHKMTYLTDLLGRGLRWMKSRPLHYPQAGEILEHFPADGFATTIRPLWGRTPFNNFLIVARRQ